MSSSAERWEGLDRRIGTGRRHTDGVLRGADAQVLTAARFNVDLRSVVAVPENLVAEARESAHATGYAAGWAQSQREAHVAAVTARENAAADARAAAVEHAATVSRAVAALAAAANRLDSYAVPTVTDLEDAVLHTALAIAETLLGRELAMATEPGRDALRRALALAPARRPVTVRLHPADHATLADASDDASNADGALAVELDGRTVTLLPDPSLAPGDAIAECDATTVDARLGSALDRIREVLA